jgi:hypothetical protein
MSVLVSDGRVLIPSEIWDPRHADATRFCEGKLCHCCAQPLIICRAAQRYAKDAGAKNDDPSGIIPVPRLPLDHFEPRLTGC